MRACALVHYVTLQQMVNTTLPRHVKARRERTSIELITTTGTSEDQSARDIGPGPSMRKQ